MINFDTIYEDNSGDLIEVADFVSGKTYITEDGTRIRFLGLGDDAFRFKVVTPSPLEGGKKISTFEKPSTALPLFWRLSNKAFRYGDTD